MTLTLTFDDVKKHFLNRYGLPDDTQVVIQRPVSIKVTVEHQRALDIIKVVESYRYTTDEKIAAIKRFRELTECGLSFSKWAIENLGKFKSFVSQFKRLPIFNGDYYAGITMS